MKKINEKRKEFAFLDEKNISEVGKKVIYLDSAATSQKPDCVIDAVSDYYRFSNANTDRSAHFLGMKATEQLEEARKKVAEFLNADYDEIVFVKGATEGINLIASTYGEESVKEGDKILTTILEHHANFLPWQELAKKKGAVLDIAKLDEKYNLKIDDILNKITEKTKIVAITGASNVTGEVPDVSQIVKKAHEFGGKIVFDASQIIGHRKIDVKKMDIDFAVFSGHKMYGPMGIGVVYIKRENIEKMPPYQFGGNMIDYVYLDKSEYKKNFKKFEAGTLNIAGVVGLKRAIEWIEETGLEDIEKHENELANYCIDEMSKIENIKIFRTTKDAVPVISFIFTDIHPHDITTILDSYNIATRAGHHCAMPLHTFLGVSATTRISFSVFNTKQDVDELIKALKKMREIFFKKG